MGAALALVKSGEDIDHWAGVIRADLNRTVEGIVSAGAHLVEAKSDVQHTEWLPMLEQIGISHAWAKKLMRVGRNPALANGSYKSHLPNSATALYELSYGPSEVIDAGISSGAVTPGMSVKEARALVRGDAPPPPPPPPVESDDPKPDPQAEADLLNAVAGCLTPLRLRHYSPKAKKHLVRILTQALQDLQEQ